MPPSKRDLRTRIRAARAARPGAERLSTSQGVLDVLTGAGLLDPAGRPGRVGAARITAYLASPGEPDPAPVRAAVLGAAGMVLLPVPGPGRALGWAHDDGRYRPDVRLPVEVPAGPVLGSGAGFLLAEDVGLVLAPALAVAADGARLGQGGGYYDTLLAGLAGLAGRVRVLAVVHDDEVLPAGSIPREEHDLLVAGAVTPTRLVLLG